MGSKKQQAAMVWATAAATADLMRVLMEFLDVQLSEVLQ